MLWPHVEAREQPSGVRSLLPPCEVQALNSGCSVSSKLLTPWTISLAQHLLFLRLSYLGWLWTLFAAQKGLGVGILLLSASSVAGITSLCYQAQHIPPTPLWNICSNPLPPFSWDVLYYEVVNLLKELYVPDTSEYKWLTFFHVVDTLPRVPL